MYIQVVTNHDINNVSVSRDPDSSVEFEPKCVGTHARNRDTWLTFIYSRTTS